MDHISLKNAYGFKNKRGLGKTFLCVWWLNPKHLKDILNIQGIQNKTKPVQSYKKPKFCAMCIYLYGSLTTH